VRLGGIEGARGLPGFGRLGSGQFDATRAKLHARIIRGASKGSSQCGHRVLHPAGEGKSFRECGLEARGPRLLRLGHLEQAHSERSVVGAAASPRALESHLAQLAGGVGERKRGGTTGLVDVERTEFENDLGWNASRQVVDV
jgi:hypothetical protein